MSSKIPFLQIDSAHRLPGGSSHNFTVQMIPAIHRCRRVSLEAVNIPLTFYNARDLDPVQVISGSNTIPFFDGTTNWLAIVPPGSYTADGLVAAVNAAFAAIFFPATLDYSLETYKFSITSSVPISLTFATIIQNSMATILGFPQVDTPFALVATAPRAFNLSVPPCIFIRVAEFPVQVRASSPSPISSVIPYGKSTDATFAVYTSVNSGGINLHAKFMTWQAELDMDVSNFSRLTISLWDPRNGEPIDLNGADWTMLLRLEYSAEAY